MSFLYCSIFGDGLHKDATTKDKFSRGLQRSLFSLLEVCGLKEGLFASTKKKSNEILDKFYDLSSLVQAASSDSNLETPCKILFDGKLKSVQLYTETYNWILSTLAKMPNFHEMSTEVGQGEIMDDSVIMEELNRLEDFSDVIKDVIKTMKVLLKFETIYCVEDAILVPHLNIRPDVQEKQNDRLRRYIGHL